MTTVPVHEPPSTRSDLRDELDRTLKHYATKADVANLKVWIVGLLLVVVLNVVGTVGAIVAAAVVRYASPASLVPKFDNGRYHKSREHRSTSDEPT